MNLAFRRRNWLHRLRVDALRFFSLSQLLAGQRLERASGGGPVEIRMHMWADRISEITRIQTTGPRDWPHHFQVLGQSQLQYSIAPRTIRIGGVCVSEQQHSSPIDREHQSALAVGVLEASSQVSGYIHQ